MLALLGAPGMMLGRKPPTGGGGPTVTPSVRAADAGTNASSNPTPAYPTNVAGDLFLMHVYCNTGAASVPSGWTQIGTAADGVVTTYVFRRDARSTGSESGTVAVTGTGSPIQARIYSIQDVATSSFVESVQTATSGTSTLNMPTVTAGGNARRAFCCIGCNSNAGMASATGESGGDWIEIAAELTSGLGAASHGQSAALSSGGAVSGGSMTHNGTRAVAVAFALVGV